MPSGHTNIDKINILKNVTSIGENAFGSCCGLKDIYYSGTRDEWKAIAIACGNDELMNATIHCTDGLAKTALDKANVSLASASRVYNGMVQTPAVTAKDGSKILKKGTDYTVVYENNKNAGTATVTSTKGNYTGTVKKTFKINPKETTVISVTAASTRPPFWRPCFTMF